MKYTVRGRMVIHFETDIDAESEADAEKKAESMDRDDVWRARTDDWIAVGSVKEAFR